MNNVSIPNNTLKLCAGAPSDEFLGQEITSSDHTFLRANVPTIQAQRRANKGRLNQAWQQGLYRVEPRIIVGRYVNERCL